MCWPAAARHSHKHRNPNCPTPIQAVNGSPTKGVVVSTSCRAARHVPYKKSLQHPGSKQKATVFHVACAGAPDSRSANSHPSAAHAVPASSPCMHERSGYQLSLPAGGESHKILQRQLARVRMSFSHHHGPAVIITVASWYCTGQSRLVCCDNSCGVRTLTGLCTEGGTCLLEHCGISHAVASSYPELAVLKVTI